MPVKKHAQTAIPIHDLIGNRWSPRAFADRPVSGDDLVAVLEAARWAASSNNMQPWRYIVATKADAGAYQRMLECLVPGNQEWAQAAPVLMISLADLKRPNGEENRHAFHDTGAASAQMTAEATARGLVIHQMGGIDREKIRHVYAVPADHDAVAGIALGYQGEPESLPEGRCEAESAPRSRKPLSEIVFSGSFGKASPLV